MTIDKKIKQTIKLMCKEISLQNKRMKDIQKYREHKWNIWLTNDIN